MADILVVDDDPNLGPTLALVLESEGHVVRLADNGRAGLHALDERLPDLVVLDVEMPELDGPGMSHEMLIHDHGREKVPVLLASGIVDLERVAERVGTPYFIEKPCSLDRLVGAVDRALREHIPPRAPETKP